MAIYLPARRVPPGGGIVIGIILGIMLWLSLITIAHAQKEPVADPNNPVLYIFADTAGVAHVYDDVYVTWIQARSSATSLPSSGVLVAFDCSAKMVMRLAQVKYVLTADSLGVTGSVEEVSLPWMNVTNPRLYNLVCAIGATRPRHDDSVPPEPPAPTPYFKS